MTGLRRPALPAVFVLSLLAFMIWTGAADAAGKKQKSKHWAPDTAALQAAHALADTPAADTPVAATDTPVAAPAADTPVSDTIAPDTRAFTARPGGRFYHDRSFAHAPPPGGAGVLTASDTMSLSDSFTACPICFETPITEEDFDLEEAIASQVSGIVEFRYRKLDNPAIEDRLRRIGLPMTKILDRNHLEFFFTPLRSSFEKNAISAGNGYIYFTTGLLDIMEDDDEVASVLAHEICHGEFRHVLQDFKLTQKLTLITAIASAVVNRSGTLGGVFQVLQDYAAQLVLNGFSRQFELEADAGAKWILESLGRDTHAMRRVLQKLDDLSRDRPDRPSVFASHPEESARIKAFDNTLVFNRTLRGDTLSMHLKFQRPRAVGWFKERAVPALYATILNERDTAVIVDNFEAAYHATDMPQVKVEVSPGSMYIPEHSYGQIKILVIAKTDLSRHPRAVDFSCTIKRTDEEAAPPKSKSKSKTEKKEKPKPERISFHFDLTDAGRP